MKKLFCIVLSVTMITCMFLVCADRASAATYPTKPVTLIIPFSSGTADTEARIFGRMLEKYLGQTIVPSNITGGSGAVGLEHTMQADPDGYTICFMSASVAMSMAHGSIKYKPNDLNVIGSFHAEAIGFYVPKDSPFKSIEELVNYAKQNPGELNVGGVNVASALHSFFLTLCSEAGVEMNYISYAGSNEVLTAFLGGNLNASLSSPNMMRGYMETGDARFLIYGSPEHDPEYEGVPIGKDVGYGRIDDLMQFRSYVTTPGVPEEVMQIIDEAFEKAFNDPEYQKHLVDINLIPFYKNRKDFLTFLTAYVENAETILANVQQ